MAFTFNPFTGNFDVTGSASGGQQGTGGGSPFFAAEVATYADLPLDVTAPLDSRFLVRSSSGTWPFSSYKQAGVYIRTATGGTSRDADYTLTDTSFHDVMSDSAFVLFDDGDATKNLKFQLSGIDTATTRTLTAPNASGTIQLTGHAAAHASSGSDPVTLQLTQVAAPDGGLGPLGGGETLYDYFSSAGNIVFSNTEDFAPASHAHAASDITSGTLDIARIPTGTGSTEVAAGNHVHGNLTSDGKIGSTSGLPVVTTTAGAVTTLALGTAGQVLTVNSGATGVEFAAASGGSGGTKTYAIFTATDNQPPATNFMTLDARNSIAVLDADDATDESAVFVGIIPEGASLGSGLKIRLHWMATTATSGSCAWDVSLERMTTDLDSDSFDTIGSAVTATSATSGIINVTEITLTTIDSVTAGDGFRLKVTRDANKTSSPADDMSGDAELVLVEVRSAA